MSAKVYVAKKYKVEWGRNGFTNNNQEFRELLQAGGISVSGDDYDSEWECETKQFDALLSYIKKYRNHIYGYENYEVEEYKDLEIDTEALYDAIMALHDMTGDELTTRERFDLACDEVVETMSDFKAGRAKDDYMHFASF